MQPQPSSEAGHATAPGYSERYHECYERFLMSFPLLDIWDSMSSNQPHETLNSSLFKPLSENLTLFKVRAKYVPDMTSGGYRLAQVCSFSKPVFNPSHMERVEDSYQGVDVNDIDGDILEVMGDFKAADDLNNVQRAIRRARTSVFDLVMCNGFDLFCTFTFSPEHIDRSNYSEAYGKIKVWLSNRVQRSGLRYVATPEYHKKGNAIHFHMLCNGEALKLADSGHKRKGQTIYNISDWKWGFTTAMFIEGENAVDKTAKYIAKYMTKQSGQKIGGRYYLSGGELQRPRYVYADDVTEFLGTKTPTYERHYDLGFTAYEEYSFL